MPGGARVSSDQARAGGCRGVLKVTLGDVDVPRWGGRIEDTQEREAEAARVDATQLDVAAVPVRGIGTPALPDAFFAVGLIDVVPSISSVGDEVDPDQGRERCATRRSGAPA